MRGDNYKQLSATAIPVVYGRSFSNIPYNKEISNLCHADSLITEAYRKTNRLISPYIEARFKALTNLLMGSGITNILEVASGLAQRGLIVAKNPAISYFDTDLPNLIHQKESLMQELLAQQNETPPSNLQFIALNALNERKFEEVVGRFPKGPIAIGHEGFFAHLNHNERTQFTRIVKNVLLERGGVWITPDIFTRRQLAKLLADGQGQEVTRDVVASTGRNYHDNAFGDVEDAKCFFQEMGFQFRIYTLGEVGGDIVSAKIGLDDESVKSQLALNIWVLNVNPALKRNLHRVKI